MAVGKSRRFELRTDEETERLISDASRLLHVSKAAFVEDAARTAARKVLARSDVTLMDAATFDSMMSAVTEPEESAALAELARLPRLIGR